MSGSSRNTRNDKLIAAYQAVLMEQLLLTWDQPQPPLPEQRQADPRLNDRLDVLEQREQVRLLAIPREIDEGG